MTQIRTDIADDAAIAALPAQRRRKEYYLGNGLHLVVTAVGVRQFVVYGRAVTAEGWVKSKPHVIGYWPTIGLKKAREYAAHYRARQAVSATLPCTPRSATRPCEPVLLQDTLQLPWSPKDIEDAN